MTYLHCYRLLACNSLSILNFRHLTCAFTTLTSSQTGHLISKYPDFVGILDYMNVISTLSTLKSLICTTINHRKIATLSVNSICRNWNDNRGRTNEAKIKMPAPTNVDQQLTYEPAQLWRNRGLKMMYGPLEGLRRRLRFFQPNDLALLF